jgi:hypothetical protein
MLDDVRGRRDAHIGYILQLYVTTPWCVDQHLADVGQAVARFWNGPDLHIVGPVGNVDVTGLLTGNDDRGSPRQMTATSVAQEGTAMAGVIGPSVLDLAFIELFPSV